MEKVYVVSWARAIGGDGTPVDAMAGSDGVYFSREQAVRALTESKDEWVSVIFDNLDDPEDKDLVRESMRIYGSESEEYYEIDYDAPDDSVVEIHITIQEVNLISEPEPS